MTIEIGGVALQRVHRVETSEQAAFVHHRVPGLAGDATQHLGRGSVRLRIEGICYGPAAQEALERLRGIYLKQEPVDFIADIVGQGYVARVTVDSFAATQRADEPDQYSYALLLVEYVPPPKQAGSAASLTPAVQAEARLLLDTATLPDALALGSLPELTNPIEPLKTALDPIREAADGLMGSLGALRGLFGE
ncbi:MAG TPA: hypothetical protein VGE07_03445 [Herpetosiphonaceae bacterium]